jgi:hypothetical protein
MLTSLDTDPYLAHNYRPYAAQWGLGYAVDARENLRLPGFAGSPELSYAHPAGGGAGTDVGDDPQNPT